MATTTLREDYLGRDLVTPTSASLDYMGRVTTRRRSIISAARFGGVSVLTTRR